MYFVGILNPLGALRSLNARASIFLELIRDAPALHLLRHFLGMLQDPSFCGMREPIETQCSADGLLQLIAIVAIWNYSLLATFFAETSPSTKFALRP